MNIQFSPSLRVCSIHTSTAISSRYKPIVYIVAAVATSSFLLILCGNSLVNGCLKTLGSIKMGIYKSLGIGSKEQVTFEQLVKKSKTFSEIIPFKTKANLIQNFATTPELQTEVAEHASKTHPLLHARVWSFIPKFLNYKKEHGTAIEKALYKNMTATQFVDRLIKNRPVTFFTSADSFLLKNGKKGKGGFTAVGTENECEEICLEKYQSYFEMSLAAFVSMFVPTHFINKGDRYNKGILEPAETHESKGIYVGMVGARFEKPGLMEWAHMIVSPLQNKAENGYGLGASFDNPKTQELRLWAEMYGSKLGNTYALPDYKEVEQDTTGRYLPISKVKNGYLDTFVYKQRMKLILESFLLESNTQAKEQGKKAYLHLVGLGLGVWGIHELQGDLILEVYAELLTKHKLSHISDLDFSYFPCEDEHCGNIGDQEIFDNKDHPIKIHFSKRNPADKLMGEDEGKLLIAQYAWDANSFPGNEYWLGMLAASGDPAAACCSMIPELQNPEINPCIQAKNLSLAPSQSKIADFANRLKKGQLSWNA